MCAASLPLALDSHYIPVSSCPRTCMMPGTQHSHSHNLQAQGSEYSWNQSWSMENSTEKSFFLLFPGRWVAFVRFLKSIEQKWSIAAASLITYLWNGFLCFLISVPQSCTSATCGSQINHLDANCLRALFSGKPRWRQFPYWINRESLAFTIYGAGTIWISI